MAQEARGSWADPILSLKRYSSTFSLARCPECRLGDLG